MENNRKKAAVALSGGVDSSVAAALLKKQGYNVVGFHMRLWKAKPDKKQQAKTEKRIKKIGKVLAIPIKFFDVKENFKKLVESYFLKEMKNGRTPNACVLCNKEIKFKFLLEKAKELSCDFLATGHYARLRRCKLLRAKDRNKDQSYFLWGVKLTPQQWAKILFPIGEIESKQKVRQIAKQFNLPTYKTPPSSDVCFLGSLGFNSFLTEKLGGKIGKIIDKQGNVLAEHQGLWFYTIGQRKGIGLSGGPWFVVRKDLKRNALVVSKNKKDLLQKELIAENINWISEKPPKTSLRVKAKIRYNAPLMKAVVKKSGRERKVIFDKPQRAITPGQSVVFYKGDELLGGGIIK